MLGAADVRSCIKTLSDLANIIKYGLYHYIALDTDLFTL